MATEPLHFPLASASTALAVNRIARCRDRFLATGRIDEANDCERMIRRLRRTARTEVGRAESEFFSVMLRVPPLRVDKDEIILQGACSCARPLVAAERRLRRLPSGVRSALVAFVAWLSLETVRAAEAPLDASVPGVQREWFAGVSVCPHCSPMGYYGHVQLQQRRTGSESSEILVLGSDGARQQVQARLQLLRRSSTDRSVLLADGDGRLLAALELNQRRAGVERVSGTLQVDGGNVPIEIAARRSGLHGRDLALMSINVGRLVTTTASSASYDGDGTHIEFRDGMAIRVKDGHHLERQGDTLVEVPDRPTRAEPDRPTEATTDTPDPQPSDPEPSAPEPPDPEPFDTPADDPPREIGPRHDHDRDPAPSPPGPPPVVPPSTPEPPPDPPAPAFSRAPNILLSAEAAAWLGPIANAFRSATGATLHVTSGTRSARRQAEAMLAGVLNGTSPRYADQQSYDEIRSAALAAQAQGLDRDRIIDRVASVIEGQMAGGRFISRHLSARGIDVRMVAPEHRQRLRDLIQSAGGTYLEERSPPHVHIQF